MHSITVNNACLPSHSVAVNSTWRLEHQQHSASARTHAPPLLKQLYALAASVEQNSVQTVVHSNVWRQSWYCSTISIRTR